MRLVQIGTSETFNVEAINIIKEEGSASCRLYLRDGIQIKANMPCSKLIEQLKLAAEGSEFLTQIPQEPERPMRISQQMVDAFNSKPNRSRK